ncbi:cupin-like domain-containing protein [Stakelama saccharophila]|uniref:Cupin-like domain-containing protein n=1 Tax=Stakelama saccharophila TaxID=3075605 RepID=A0ABZ0B9S6_9SPHN|nr:cupin-like domain-containing protein [Stakelama sp. W311]WNO54033.1 cupin-like domain-containing protein [Stakelama sp. W311]
MKERDAVDSETFDREIASGYEPVLLRGQVADWPAVRAGANGHDALAAYINRFAGGAPTDVLIGPPDIEGRFFYSGDMRGVNFDKRPAPLPALVAELLKLRGVERPPSVYASAAAAQTHLPGWPEENPLGLPMGEAVARLWIGNATQVATHYDMSSNLACVVAGKRRFTLFPPEQLVNLYVGPLDRTIAGAPVSMVDPDQPDIERYPHFAEALDHARIAELEPGDALFIPAIWWHHVRAFDTVNVLVNYWQQRDQAKSPFLTLLHAMVSLRDLDPALKRAWRAWFDHYVFGDDADHAADHLPEDVRGIAGPDSPERTEQMRRFLIASLNAGR